MFDPNTLWLIDPVDGSCGLIKRVDGDQVKDRRAGNPNLQNADDSECSSLP